MNYETQRALKLEFLIKDTWVKAKQTNLEVYWRDFFDYVHEYRLLKHFIQQDNTKPEEDNLGLHSEKTRYINQRFSH